MERSLNSTNDPITDYIMYLDETGDHTITPSEDIGKRYLGLSGPIVTATEDIVLKSRTDEFKRAHLPCQSGMPILHRKEIMQCQGPFSCLVDECKKAAFDASLIQLLKECEYSLIGVVIDKNLHGKKSYRKLTHPYHYCLYALIERYCRFLHGLDATGQIIAEARGKTEDFLLKAEYQKVWQNGTPYLHKSEAQRRMPSPEIAIYKKRANMVGLQIADLLAHPVTRNILVSFRRAANHGSPFAERVVEAVIPRYCRSPWSGAINGYGRVFLS